MLKSYLTEFIGTFFLVLTIGLSTANGPDMSRFAPIAIGAVVMVMVYMGGHVSGAHYNPAVSLAAFLRGKLSGRDLIPYWVVQIAGAFVAAAVVYLTVRDPGSDPGTTVPRTFGPDLAPGVTIASGLLYEFLFTFALALVILNSATAPGTKGNSFYGLAIGFTVTGAAYAVGGITGGAFNPAVGTGPLLTKAVVAHGPLNHLWVYWVAPLAGGAAAAGVYRVQNPEPRPGETTQFTAGPRETADVLERAGR